MFQLSHMQETIHIWPADFGKPILSAITDVLNQKYPNKVTGLAAAAHATQRRARPAHAGSQVIIDLGLCIALHSILSVGESQLLPGNPCQHVAVEYQLIIFKPYIGEILTGAPRPGLVANSPGRARSDRHLVRPCEIQLSAPCTLPPHARPTPTHTRPTPDRHPTAASPRLTAPHRASPRLTAPHRDLPRRRHRHVVRRGGSARLRRLLR